MAIFAALDICVTSENQTAQDNYVFANAQEQSVYHMNI